MGLPANQCIPVHEGGPALTGKCTADVIGKRLVKITADRDAALLLNTSSGGGNYKVAHATAALNTHVGVAAYDAANGTLVKFWLKGVGNIVPIKATGAIAFGVEVEAAANGTVSTKTSGVAIGLCMTGAADLADAEILLY